MFLIGVIVAVVVVVVIVLVFFFLFSHVNSLVLFAVVGSYEPVF